MTFCEELYFEITLHGRKADLKNFVSFLKSGELDEFFEVSPEYIDYDDEFESKQPNDNSSIIFSNDDYGIKIDEFDTDEFLELFCRAAKPLYVEGRLFDIDDEEYEFVSAHGDTYYVNAKFARRSHDELDEKAYEEDMYED